MSATHESTAPIIESLDHWIAVLRDYTADQLQTSPAPAQWSLGQLYEHLLRDTNYYLDQVAVCAASADHAHEGPSAAGQAMLLQNAFPPVDIIGGPDHDHMPQPRDQQELLARMIELRSRAQQSISLVNSTACAGKALHPGLGYFSATEWLQFADMHFRHHLRQKKKLDRLVGKYTQ